MAAHKHSTTTQVLGDACVRARRSQMLWKSMRTQRAFAWTAYRTELGFWMGLLWLTGHPIHTYKHWFSVLVSVFLVFTVCFFCSSSSISLVIGRGKWRMEYSGFILAFVVLSFDSFFALYFSLLLVAVLFERLFVNWCILRRKTTNKKIVYYFHFNQSSYSITIYKRSRCILESNDFHFSYSTQAFDGRLKVNESITKCFCAIIWNNYDYRVLSKPNEAKIKSTTTSAIGKTKQNILATSPNKSE